MISDSLYVPLAVVGLTILALIITDMYQRYEADQARRHTLAKKEIQLIDKIEKFLIRLSSIPLSIELRNMLRVEIVDRYTKIADFYPKYPNLAVLMLQAGERMKAEKNKHTGIVPSPDNAEALAQITYHINSLITFLNETPLSHPLPAESIPSFIEELGETRAKISFNSYSSRAKKRIADNDTLGARTLIGELNGVLHSKGPNTQLVRDLYQESGELYAGYAKSSSDNATPTAETAPENTPVTENTNNLTTN